MEIAKLKDFHYLGASTDPVMAFTWSLHKSLCPVIPLQIDGKQFRGITDTGTDLSIISPNTGPCNQTTAQNQADLDNGAFLQPKKNRELRTSIIIAAS